MGGAGAGALAALLLAAGAALAAAQTSQPMPSFEACYSGLAELEKVADECQPQLKRLLPLTFPWDPSEQQPWDCLDSMLVSVEGCKVSIVSLRNASSLLPDFSCSWLEYQGAVDGDTSARVAAWVRPVPAAMWTLGNTNLTASHLASMAANKPADWQARLAGVFGLNGSPLTGVRGNQTVVLRQNDRCNTEFRVRQGAFLGAGTRDESSLGMVVTPALEPFAPPLVIRGVPPGMHPSSGGPAVPQRQQGTIALITILAVLGAFLLASLVFLAVRLARAPKAAAAAAASRAASPYGQAEQGAGGTIAMSSLESQARQHGPAGGI